MFELTASQAISIGLVVAPVLFAACAFFTRASLRRIAGALVGSAAYGGLSWLWDHAALALGWWSYPAFSESEEFPLAGYALAGIAGGAMGFIGWRIFRRWGWRGLTGWLAVWFAYGLVHDYGGSQAFSSSNLMAFGPGPIPIIADMIMYVTLNSAPLLSMRLIAGPAATDPLARMPHPS